jgi:hypothetical protein
MDGTLIASSAGTCLVTATKAADANYASASSVQTTVTFGVGVQSTLVVSSTSATYPNSLVLTTTGGSGTGTVSYVVTNGTASGCTNTSGTLTATSAGTCLVTATKAADANYASASSVQTTVTFVLEAITGLTVTAPTGTVTAGTPANWTLTATPAVSGTYTLTGTTVSGELASPSFATATATNPTTVTFTAGAATVPVTLVAVAAQTLEFDVTGVTSTGDAAVTPVAGAASSGHATVFEYYYGGASYTANAAACVGAPGNPAAGPDTGTRSAGTYLYPPNGRPIYWDTTTASQTRVPATPTGLASSTPGCWVITVQAVDAYGNAEAGSGSVPVSVTDAVSGNSAWASVGGQITSLTPVAFSSGTGTIYYFVTATPTAGQDNFVVGPGTTPGITTTISAS